jgi:1-acyl-sn-glycerol-3-phosphate acyltransferase
VELGVSLEEKTGVHIADDDLTASMTVGQLQALVGSGSPAAAPEARQLPAEWPLASRWPYGPLGRLFGWVGLPFTLLYRYGAETTYVLGGRHLVSLPRRVLLAGTHRSWPDMLAVRHALSRTPAQHLANRMLVAAAAVGLANAGPLGWIAILGFRCFPLRQYRDREESLRRLAALANAGDPILIFPQGHHIDPAAERAGDPTADFRPGAAHLAEALDAVVVPFGIAGTEKLVLPTAEGYRGFVLAGIPVKVTRGPVAVAFGPPLTRQPDETAQAFSQRLQEVCFALARQAETTIAEGQVADIADRQAV